MLEMMPFVPEVPRTEVVFDLSDVPKEFDIFWRDYASFLPPGKTIAELTDAERKAIGDMYRFTPYRPGIYQGITGMGPMVG